MRQIAKWTILCVICTALGFGATFLVAHSDRVIQTFAAMLPVPAQPAVEELATVDTLPVVAPAEVSVDVATTEETLLDATE